MKSLKNLALGLQILVSSKADPDTLQKLNKEGFKAEDNEIVIQRPSIDDMNWSMPVVTNNDKYGKRGKKSKQKKDWQ